MIAKRFSLPLEIKASDVAGSGEFAGYAAVFGNVDLGGDVILPGAFERTLADHKKRGVTPPLLWSHDTHVVLGRVNDLREDRKGLYAEARLSLGTTAGAETYALLRDRAVGGMSIGYSTVREDAGDRRARLLKEIELYEVSLVAVPMNPDARVTAVKAALDCAHPRELDRLLRDALGLSRRKAHDAANALWPILNGPGAQDDDLEDHEADSRLTAIAGELKSFNDLLKGKLS